MCEMEVKQTKGGFQSRSNKIEAYMAVAKSENGENLWFLDTGATHHLTHNKSLLHNYKTLPQIVAHKVPLEKVKFTFPLIKQGE